MSGERLLTAQEVAGRLGVSIHTVYRLAGRAEGLPACKIGRLTRFRPADVEKWLAAQSIDTGQEREQGVRRFAYRPGMRVVELE